MLTWNQLADYINKMPINVRDCFVLTQDEGTGQLFGYEGINEPAHGLPHLLEAANKYYKAIPVPQQENE